MPVLELFLHVVFSIPSTLPKFPTKILGACLCAAAPPWNFESLGAVADGQTKCHTNTVQVMLRYTFSM